MRSQLPPTLPYQATNNLTYYQSISDTQHETLINVTVTARIQIKPFKLYKGLLHQLERKLFEIL